MARPAAYPRVNIAPETPKEVQQFDFTGGLDTETPDLLMKAGRLPYVRNARVLAADDDESRVPLSTRKGPSHYSVPLGETLNAQQTSVVGAANQSIGLITYKAAKFTATATGRLTKVELNLKTTTPAGTGPVIVEIRADSSGSPSTTILAQSSVLSSSISASAAYLTARFIEAPQVTNTTAYWIVAYIQDDGSNTYHWTSTTTATTTKASADSGSTWSTTSYDLNFKTYISTDSPTLGLYRAYRSTGSPVQLLAHGTNLYSVNDGTGATTSIKSGLTSTATDYYFVSANNTVYYVNGKDAPRKWDFTTESAVTGSPPVSSLIVNHKNRNFYVEVADPTRVSFTDAGAYETIGGTSFFYVPTPKSTDPIKSVFVSMDNLVFATRETKYVLYGSDLASFVLRHAVGTVGTVSHNTVAEYQGMHYFLSDDGVYRFNGSIDEKISERRDGSGITREINNIADKTKCMAVIWNGQYRLYYPASGSSVNNRCLIYDIVKDSWWLDTNVYVSRASIWSRDPDSNQLLEGSSVVGAANKAEQQYSDMGRRIDWEFRLPYTAYGSPAATKKVTKYRPQLRASQSSFNIDCQVDKDYSNSPTSSLHNLQGNGYLLGASTPLLGAITLGNTALVSPKVNVSGKAKYFQKRYKRSGVGNNAEYLGYVELFLTQETK